MFFIDLFQSHLVLREVLTPAASQNLCNANCAISEPGNDYYKS